MSEWSITNAHPDGQNNLLLKKRGQSHYYVAVIHRPEGPYRKIQVTITGPGPWTRKVAYVLDSRTDKQCKEIAEIVMSGKSFNEAIMEIERRV